MLLRTRQCQNAPAALAVVEWRRLDARRLAAGVRWQNLGLRAGVNNLSERDPPFLNGGFANAGPATRRLLGQTWFMQLEYALE